MKHTETPVEGCPALATGLRTVSRLSLTKFEGQPKNTKQRDAFRELFEQAAQHAKPLTIPKPEEEAKGKGKRPSKGRGKRR